ncbi:hypothetical protein [uncultured Mailhella sp.]|uniref:hypothetical protein n=1 Tax=uncultured Mailhella sp. TaxID=1981031 RepID=UPI0025F5D8EF|nr:hypothetical protein [uncultured Mailhella sp.]
MRIKTLFTGFCCGILLAPAMAFAADSAPAPKAEKQTVADTPFVIVAPSEEIVVTFPLFVVERGVVESVDVKKGTFTLKDKQGEVSTIKVTDNTLVENVYADIFTWDTKKGIADLKKGDKVRARVFPGDDGQPSSAISLDVYKF